MSLINDALNRAQADKLNAAQRAPSASGVERAGSVSDGAGCRGREVCGHATPGATTSPGAIAAPGATAAPFAACPHGAVLPPTRLGKINGRILPPPVPPAASSSASAASRSGHLWLLLFGTLAVAGAFGYRFYDAGATKPRSAIGQVQPQPPAQTPIEAQDSGLIVIRPADPGPALSRAAAAAVTPPPDAPGQAAQANDSGDVVLEDLTPARRGLSDAASRDHGPQLPDGEPNMPAPAAADPAQAAQPTLPAQLKLDGIIFGPDGGAAIISGRSIRIGQEICGAKVTKITRGEVELDFHGQTITLRL